MKNNIRGAGFPGQLVNIDERGGPLESRLNSETRRKNYTKVAFVRGRKCSIARFDRAEVISALTKDPVRSRV